MVTSAVGLPRGLSVLSRFSTPADLPAGRIPTRFNVLFRQHAGVSLLRLHITPYRSNGMLTVSSIGYALRLPLRSRLTLIRLALIRNPWSCGEGFPAPLSLLIPTFAFPAPPARLAPRLHRLPECSPTNHALRMIPRLRHRTYARLLSMRDHSTSELLRTL